MNIQLIPIGPGSNCVKITKGDKELSISFKTVNNNTFVQSVGLFQEKGEDQFFNNVNGEEDIARFMEWLSK